MTSPQRHARSSTDLKINQRSASTGGDVPVTPEQHEAQGGRQCPPGRRVTGHAHVGISAQHPGVRKSEGA